MQKYRRRGIFYFRSLDQNQTTRIAREGEVAGGSGAMAGMAVLVESKPRILRSKQKNEKMGETTTNTTRRFTSA